VPGPAFGDIGEGEGEAGAGFRPSRTPGAPCIITVAITGSLPRKSHNPAVPITVAEQLDSTEAAFEAGATVVHVHVRRDDGTPTSDPERFARFLEGVRARCPGIIVQFSTGGRSGEGVERGGMLHLAPDMASLTPGSCNFPGMVYANPPALIHNLAEGMRRYGVKPELEVFDLSMLTTAIAMAREGVLSPPLHLQFVLGVKGALPAERRILEILVGELGTRMPDATWSAAGIGRHQVEVNRWTLELGGHARTGLEDNVRLDRATLAPSNAALVAQVAELCTAFERPVATPREARATLGLVEGPRP
jgi:3-keto-5-aminohexanoate cleavage enzyme